MGKAKYTDTQLVEAVKTSTSIAEVLRKLGLRQAGGTHKNITTKISALNLDTSHFVGQLWSKGKTALDDSRIRTRCDIEEIFCEGSLASQTTVRKYLIQYELIEYLCGRCNGREWLGQQLTLELHHKNGDNSDNRIDNLVFLCPNCHSLTPSFKKRDNKRRLTKVSDDDILKVLGESKNIRQMCQKLRIRADGDNYGMIRRRLRMLGVNLG